MAYDNTKKKIVDDLTNILTRESKTDESRLDENFLSWKIDQVRAQKIIESYQNDGVIDRAWVSDISIQTLHEVNYSDDPNISFCCSEVSKVFLPNVVSIRDKKSGNIDLGFLSVMDVCGTKEYTPFPMTTWGIIPKEHVRSKFRYYDRINTAFYVNKKVTSLLFRCILEHPEDGYIVESESISSGSLVNGTVYIVKKKPVIYNGVTYPANSTFTATAVTTFAGYGTVYLQDQLQAITETQPYPCSSDMARAIILDICVKEFGIEASQITDIENNSVDDQQKAKTP